MEISKKILMSDFLQVAEENNYETFSKEEIANYYKNGIMKSRDGGFTDVEKDAFVTDIASLKKAICVDENGVEQVMYFRKSQVNWEVAEDGTILKGVEGVYADTPENNKLNRVGMPYVAEPDIVKSILDVNCDIEKAVRNGRYADTPENRRLHRVGQPYKKSDSKGGDNKKSEESYEEKPDENGNYPSITEWVNAERAVVSKAEKDPAFKEKVVNELAKRSSLDKQEIAKHLSTQIGGLRFSQLSKFGEEAGVKFSEKSKQIFEQREKKADERRANLKSEMAASKKANAKKMTAKEWDSVGKYHLHEDKDSGAYEILTEHPNLQREIEEEYGVKISWDGKHVVYEGKPKDLAKMLNDDEGYDESEENEPGYIKMSNFLDEEHFTRATSKS